MDLASVNIKVHGRVTGIGFRAFARVQGRALGLNGYARNLSDGSVLVEAEGEKPKLERLVARLRKGPPLSKVRNLEVTWSAYRGLYRDFTIA